MSSGTDPEASVRALRVVRFERAGVDPDRVDSAAPALGALARWLPDFYHRLILGEVSAAEWAELAGDLEEAARLCREHAEGGAA